MAESADNTPPGVTALEEESDVIELTEEVRTVDSEHSAHESDEGETLEGMGLEMPEFKVPEQHDGTAEEPADEEPTTQRLSKEALEEAAAVDGQSQDGAVEEVETAGGDEEMVDDEEPLDSEDEDGGEQGYDRQSMVKTIQMDAFDREAIEALGSEDEEDELPILGDARFAPEIVACQPRVLVKKWREGLPGSVERIVGEPSAANTPTSEGPPPSRPQDEAPSAGDEEVPESIAEDSEEPMELDDAALEAVAIDAKSEDKSASMPETMPETPAMGPVTSKIEIDEELLEADEEDEEYESVELDEELIELDDEDVEPKGPAKPAPPEKPAPPADLPPKSEEPARPEQAPKEKKKEPEPARAAGAGAGDDDMRGLVEELLEEEREQKKKKQQKKRPVRPQDVWFEKVFSKEYLRTVPSNIASITSKDADFIEASLKLKKKSRILDLACGFGRHSVELCERGYEMVGLDLSRPLLERALEEATNRSLNVKFIRGDMRDLKFSGMFDGCFVWDTSLGYFDDRTNLRVLKGIHRSLKTGGRLLVDVVNRDYVVRQTPTRLWWEGKGCIFLEESEFDYQTSTLQAQRSYIYEDGSPPMEHTSYIRLYNVHELRQMLHVAGFKVLEVSGARHHKGYFLGASSPRIIILAEKRARKQAPKKK